MSSIVILSHASSSKDGAHTSSEQLKNNFDEYLKAMKQATMDHRFSAVTDLLDATPRERRRRKAASIVRMKTNERDLAETVRISTIASMLPDEIIYRHTDYSIRSYETALMFIDVSGFTDLCEAYTNHNRGGPSQLTQVLNSYIGAMVQEILSHNGDVLKFSGDAFLSMWRTTEVLTMQDVVHTAIDCGLIIQKNYGRYVTDIGVVLKVKVAISAGVSRFGLVGDENASHFVLVGQPVWDVKTAEYMSSAGDVLTTASAWCYVNETEYCTQPCGDGRTTKVLGIGATWKRVEKIEVSTENKRVQMTAYEAKSFRDSFDSVESYKHYDINYREYSLRPAVIKALRSSSWPELRRFMVTPVLLSVDNDEPLDFLTEVRNVIVVFFNIITETVTDDVLIGIVDIAYRTVYNLVYQAGGLVNKVSMFDKDMMFLVVFGLRGLKHQEEAQKALLCAHKLKEALNGPNIISVSVGVTSGRTYCGVVGHVLRREYTVIGPAVNKAARLMIAYPNVVTCDKETFVRSKLDLDLFRLVKVKVLKGIKNVGPIYEFNHHGWTQRNMPVIRHPILGRDEELSKFKRCLQNAIDHEHEHFTRYRDHKYAICVTGPRFSGKTRLVDEFVLISAKKIELGASFTLFARDVKPYHTARTLLSYEDTVTPNLLTADSMTSFKPRRDAIENRIRYCLNLPRLTALHLYALNTIFGCRFPLPENYTYTGDLLSELSVRRIVREVFKSRYPSLQMVAIRRAEYIDDESWRILLIILDAKMLFVVLSVIQEELLSTTGKEVLSNGMIVHMKLTGIERWYHAALTCQLLDVQAIPSDLVKVVQSASGGMPGWIQNFVINLIQRGQLTVVTVPRNEAVELGAVMPSPTMLTTTTRDSADDGVIKARSNQSLIDSLPTMMRVRNDQQDLDSSSTALPNTDKIQMAVLTDVNNFNIFDNMKMDVEMDVIILKTYDSLSLFEKTLLKCGAVLGEMFSRRMLLHLLQSDCQYKIASAVARLFEIRVLECEGGDFTQDTSMVLIHPAPVPAITISNPPFCSCLGTRAPPTCQDLPNYAFCGYMKFRHALFRKTTYELLPENQKTNSPNSTNVPN